MRQGPSERRSSLRRAALLPPLFCSGMEDFFLCIPSGPHPEQPPKARVEGLTIVPPSPALTNGCVTLCRKGSGSAAIPPLHRQAVLPRSSPSRLRLRRRCRDEGRHPGVPALPPSRRECGGRTCRRSAICHHLASPFWAQFWTWLSGHPARAIFALLPHQRRRIPISERQPPRECPITLAFRSALLRGAERRWPISPPLGTIGGATTARQAADHEIATAKEKVAVARASFMP